MPKKVTDAEAVAAEWINGPSVDFYGPEWGAAALPPDTKMRLNRSDAPVGLLEYWRRQEKVEQQVPCAMPAGAAQLVRPC